MGFNAGVLRRDPLAIFGFECLGAFSYEDLTKRVESAVFKAFELLPGDDYEVVPRLDVVAR